MTRYALLFVSAFTLTGCVTSAFIANQATQYNLALEKNSNEVILLNVIRASQRRPLYFTSLSKFSGAGGSVGGQLQLPLGSGSSSAYTFSPQTTLNPAFDVAPLDTQEFIAGFLKPVGIETIEYYWRGGWPQSLLLTLFVGRFEKEQQSIIENYPPMAQEYICFKDYLEFLLNPRVGGPLLLQSQERSYPLGPPLDKDKVSDVNTLIEIANDPKFLLTYN